MRQGVEFREHHRGPTWLRIVGTVAAMLAIAGLFIGIRALVRDWGSPDTWSLAIGLVVLTVVGGVGFTTLIWNTIEVVVEDAALVAWLRPLRVLRVPIDGIAAAQAATVSPREGAGIGFRWTPNGTYLLWRAGPAVEIRTRRERTIYVRTDHPDALLAAIGRPSTKA